MFILASASPRRKELLSKIISNFKVIPSSLDESKFKEEEIAYQKGFLIASRFSSEVVISADTQVIFNHKVYGKPTSKEDAFNMLKILSNNKHEVITYFSIFCLDKKIIYSSKEVSFVTFNDLDDELINTYITSGSPLDKAGSYGIQDNNKFHIIKEYSGSLDNIIGLPVEALKKALISLNLI